MICVTCKKWRVVCPEEPCDSCIYKAEDVDTGEHCNPCTSPDICCYTPKEGER